MWYNKGERVKRSLSFTQIIALPNKTNQACLTKIISLANNVHERVFMNLSPTVILVATRRE